ncbi:hypothetical protein Fmac_019890 [Flemingia macrophylla]|uniref:Protein kinase domain-containing protein n=1 Tax=Flemingia macrophylla TaxID=520843 RepID=A0ABD1M958_9FABA
MAEKYQNQISTQYTEQDDSLLKFNKHKYSYSTVRKITNNFNTIVGKGGFGTVYLGYIDDTPVAVKMLSPSSVHGYQQFQAEVKLLLTVHHKNLTSLVGYCNDGTNKGLIYEYMANGNLHEHLSGLEYLQNGCKPPIIHRDVKSTNILLNEHLQAKLSDFGLSKIMPTDGVTHVSTVVAGTPGYLDPHDNEEGRKYVSSLITKGDIKAIVDSRLEDFDSDSAWKVVKIAMACVSPKPSERPLMKMIVTELMEALPTFLLRNSKTGSSEVMLHDKKFERFISIDCGAPEDVNYTESNTGINYISDAKFINTGVSKTVVSELKNDYQRQLWTVRSFPEGKRNCYKINIISGSRYLIRASFLYGSYDGLNKLPEFDLLLGANWWETVTIYNGSAYLASEIIYVPSLDYVEICLVDTGHGTPFISAIEFRTLKKDTYVTQFGSLQLYGRCDLGTNTTDKAYRYNYDVYDRFWGICDFKQDWTQLNVLISADSLGQNDYQPPAIVLSTAVSPANVSAPLVLSWKPLNETEQLYVYMHTELEVLAKNQTRIFTITENGQPRYLNFSPPYLSAFTVYSQSATSGKEIKYSFEMAKSSTLPPIISAIEIYRVKDFQQANTFQGDVDAITTIKSVYGVRRDWQGDPCAPVAYLWDGLNCTYPGNESQESQLCKLCFSNQNYCFIKLE